MLKWTHYFSGITMLRRSAVGIALLVMVVALQPLSAAYCDTLQPQENPDGWNLVFQDNFPGQRLNTENWVTCYWWDWEGCTNEGSGEDQWYLPDNVSVRGGALRLEAREETVEEATNGETYAYTSGMVTTGRSESDTNAPGKFIFQYGYVEVRADPPSGQGLWSAIWLLPEDHTSKPEIDMVEILGNQPETLEMHVQFLDENGERSSDGWEWYDPELAEGAHTFAVDWQPDLIIWYLDGTEVWRYTPESPWTTPMYLLINLAVGGDWGGPPDSSTVFPSEFVVDYVRIWQRKADPSESCS